MDWRLRTADPAAECEPACRGLEWEATRHAPAPLLFGQTLVIQPGHPGVPEPHYMLHAYFRPVGEVLFSVFDPQLSCPLPGVSRDAASFEAQPSDTMSLFGAVSGPASAEQWATERPEAQPRRAPCC
jgi:hypothetical protein